MNYDKGCYVDMGLWGGYYQILKGMCSGNARKGRGIPGVLSFWRWRDAYRTFLPDKTINLLLLIQINQSIFKQILLKM